MGIWTTTRRAGLAGAWALLAPLTTYGQVTERVSVDSSGVQGNGWSGYLLLSCSADGRYVAFYSLASNLVLGDTNAVGDVFVRDRLAQVTERASVDSSGLQANSTSDYPSLSADGRYVAFSSLAGNLVGGDGNGCADIFVRDRVANSTERVSVGSGGEGNGHAWRCSISANGRWVAFHSLATTLVPGDTNACTDVFVRDRLLATTERISVSSSGAQANDRSEYPAISADGRFVAFQSDASDLVPGDTNGVSDVFVHDLQSGTTERVSVGSSGAQGNNVSYTPSLSADGRYVAFHGSSTNLVPGDTNGAFDVFVRDRLLGTTERISVDSTGVQGNDMSSKAAISGDGRFVAFDSLASNLVPNDTNGGNLDVFVRDRQNATTVRASVDSAGVEANSMSSWPAISGDGRFVVFDSLATNLVAGDTNTTMDVFVREHNVSGFTTSCSPGTPGVLPCPCQNPPGGFGRGCDNSSATGGATLSASGTARLSSDLLVFTSSGERPSALSIVLQGSAEIPAGLAFGQGVRCVSGALRRLYSKTAAAGAISAPDFGAGDPSVSARSAALGDPIQAGESRWYLVYYRDPLVLGGCPGIVTFNCTQTGRIDWQP